MLMTGARANNSANATLKVALRQFALLPRDSIILDPNHTRALLQGGGVKYKAAASSGVP